MSTGSELVEGTGSELSSQLCRGKKSEFSWTLERKM